ncbi:MAG: hypothetical protein ACXWR0_19265 [Bdellovibrio sp.]
MSNFLIVLWNHFYAHFVNLFLAPPAISAIFKGSAGILRKANGLARGGLIAAATEKEDQVSAEHIRLASTDSFNFFTIDHTESIQHIFALIYYIQNKNVGIVAAERSNSRENFSRDKSKALLNK